MNRRNFALFAAVCLSFSGRAQAAETDDRTRVGNIVDAAVRPMMVEGDIPGAAVGVTVGGKEYVFCYGVADKKSGRKVTSDTIFEIGSVSKTFTATLGAYAQVQGVLSPSDPASKYLPALSGTEFDRVRVLDLATFTAGGLPLQFPDEVTTHDQMIAFYRAWKPDQRPGTSRRYSNPSIGLYGHLAAKSMAMPFDELMQKHLLSALGLKYSFITVPNSQIENYAFGYTKENKRIRVAPGLFDAEAYGVKSTAADVLRFVKANIDAGDGESALHRAILQTHIGRFQIGPMAQGLGWEIVRYPTSLDTLLAANSSEMAFTPQKAIPIAPTARPLDDILINKTGSTNGFAAYAAFVPKEKVGVVILANKNFPIPARVKAAYAILRAIGAATSPTKGQRR
ncbi:class C beta-lactamase [Chelatococcus asaccharovorans]|uniref:class C beta-lactamase n=1 Tax=Chelatococcus asaccharovorans TaxID=28210 RepID=UPI00224C7035|nr:class C beta-lactamase [Chelatococcus asaccharovorans]CAH1673854.1 Beta-lactamase [Chelatococcus asaccharovorans]CAH1674749.1 Beta-lactamase [Chelatococcus asaccharovorans]